MGKARCWEVVSAGLFNNWNHGPIGTREELKIYDPDGYELVRTTFNLSPEQDWRYHWLQKLPNVNHTFGQTETHRLTSTTALDNAPSMRVLRELGFQEEGILPDWALWKGEFKDLRCCSLLRAERR